ncbi:MAG: hypothetical protein NC338_03305 [Firmicutes bacterium]|nr:hypothetical protein [Bacillota bacterium]MCM1401838.1 hypothetical protein [Bacteroides sp.]MCM1477723.1 hypothetical protein [Bacteroides sp.]
MLPHKFIPLLTAVLWTLGISASADAPNRRYHDNITQICDTTILISIPDSAPLSQALEIRGKLPQAADFSPLQALGVLWNVNAAENEYYSATIRPCNPMPDEVFDYRFVMFDVCRHTAAGDSTIFSHRFKDLFGMDRAENTLGVEIDFNQRIATVYGGEKQLEEIIRIQMDAPVSPLMGVCADGRADLSLVVSEWIPNPRQALITPWTKQEISTYLAKAQPPEGLYKYLDRNTDPRLSRPGGNYTLALIKASAGGYDLIYIDGAATNATQWEPGMLKARLTPTIFQNQYDLVWYDSMFNALAQDCSASIEQGAILTINIPAIKASMRFSLVPQDK